MKRIIVITLLLFCFSPTIAFGDSTATSVTIVVTNDNSKEQLPNRSRSPSSLLPKLGEDNLDWYLLCGLGLMEIVTIKYYKKKDDGI